MAEVLRLFVSATRDLEPQRAVIGRAIAGLPVRVGIEIWRTPVEHAAIETIFDLVANCDRVYFLLGRDITAPMGSEWDIAHQLDRSVLTLRADVPLTPAAREFLHLTGTRWLVFHDDEELVRLISRDVINTLLHPMNRYGLTPEEIERLLAYRRHLQPQKVTNGKLGGAEAGGVLLDDLRREPIEGHLLERRDVMGEEEGASERNAG